MYTRTVQKEIKELLHAVAAKLDCDYDLVEDVYFHEFEFTTKQMAKGEQDEYPTFENILLKHFGSFIANEKYLNKFKELNKARRVHEEQGEEDTDTVQ